MAPRGSNSHTPRLGSDLTEINGIGVPPVTRTLTASASDEILEERSAGARALLHVAGD
jgi:hypothetical protein